MKAVWPALLGAALLLTGCSSNPTVPNLSGRTLMGAILTAEGLNVDARSGNAALPRDAVDTLEWTVLSQNPAPGTNVREGTTVTVNLRPSQLYLDKKKLDADIAKFQREAEARQKADRDFRRKLLEACQNGGTCAYVGGTTSSGSSGGGYPVICNDGTTSNAGGKQGACSWHGGTR